jgi:hypothetical protein
MENQMLKINAVFQGLNVRVIVDKVTHKASPFLVVTAEAGKDFWISGERLAQALELADKSAIVMDSADEAGDITKAKSMLRNGNDVYFLLNGEPVAEVSIASLQSLTALMAPQEVKTKLADTDRLAADFAAITKAKSASRPA